jgi:putative PEP-CTERM system TPR-repeat lipoprotein
MKFAKATLCLSVLLALSACGEKETAESHLINAKKYISTNKVNESIIELKNAIRLNTQNAEARFLLGRTYLELGDGLPAIKELERAQSLKAKNSQLIPLLARAYILTDSDLDVIALSDEATTLAKEEQSQYLAYKTLAALRSEDPELAKESAELAQKLAGQGLYSMLAQAYLQLSNNKTDEASTLIARILVIDSKQVDALMLQGQVATVVKDYTLASDSYKQYLDLQPRSGIVQLLLADVLLKANKFEAAEQYADVILASVSTQPFANYIKAMARFQAQDFANASKHAEAALSGNFNQLSLKLVAGASAFHLKNWEQSYHHLDKIAQYLPSDHQAKRMLAVSQLELGLVNEINSTLVNFENDNSDKKDSVNNAQFLSSMSFKLLELGAIDEAKKLVNQNDGLGKNNAEHNARQGLLKLMMNDPSGIEDLRDAVKLNPELVEAELALAFAALQSGDIKQATEIATKWQNNYPKKAGGYNLMASVAIKQEKYENAERALKQSLTVEPDNIFALIEQLRIARKQKNDELSKQRADYLITLYPNNNKVLRQYFGTYQNEMALAKLSTAYELDKTDVKKATLLSEALVSLQKLTQAANVLTSLEGNAQLPKSYWQLLLLIYNQQKDLDKMQTTLGKWLKASPYHIEPVILLADLHAKKRNHERALSVVRRGLETHQDNVTLQLVKMQLLLNSNQIILAKELYQVLALKDVNAALKEGLLGRILLLENNHEQALPKLTQFYQAYPSNQNVVYLASAYLGNNEKNKAIALLENYLKEQPKSDRVKAMLAGLYINNGDNKAITTYAEIVKTQPKNVVVNNNLAWLYLENGQIEKALFHAKTAFDLAPKNASVVDTYGKILLENGDKREALKYSAKASSLSKDKDIDIALNYVEALIANNRLNEAKAILEKAVTTTAEQKEKKSQLLATL